MRNAFNMLFVLLVIFLFTGCVSVNQKAKVEKDGSGSLTLHYWASMKNLKSQKELGGFSFEESKIKSKYASSNNEVKNVKVENKLDDSTTHVWVDIDFKNINNLNSASGYSKVTPSMKEAEDAMEFSYTIQKDTSASKNMGAEKHELTYEFEFPGEVMETNGIKDGNKAKWEKSLKDLKEDLVFTAKIKNDGGSAGGKKCGMFGFELPLVMLAGVLYMARKKNKAR